MDFNEINRLNVNVPLTPQKEDGVKEISAKKHTDNPPVENSPIDPNYWQGAKGIPSSAKKDSDDEFILFVQNAKKFLDNEQLENAIKLKKAGFDDWKAISTARDLSNDKIALAVKIKERGFDDISTVEGVNNGLSDEQIDIASKIKEKGFYDISAISGAQNNLTDEQIDVATKAKEKGCNDSFAFQCANENLSDSQIDIAIKIKEKCGSTSFAILGAKELPSNKINTALTLIEKGFAPHYAIDGAKEFSEQEIKIAQRLIANNFADYNAFTATIELSPQQIDIAIELKQLGFDDSSSILGAKTLPASKIQVASYLKENGFDSESAIKGAQELNIEQVSGVLNIQEELKNYGFEDSEIFKLAQLSPDKYKQAQTLFVVPQRGEDQLSIENICKLVNLDKKEYSKLEQYLFSSDKSKQITGNDVNTAIEFVSLIGIKNSNEIPLSEKKNLVRKLVSSNSDLFTDSEIMKEALPILPKNKEEYCTLLPTIVRSLGVNSTPLNDKEKNIFYEALSNLGSALKNMDDNDFNNLDIKQEYSKDSFIKDVLSKTKNIDEEEKQKIFDYFGFELKENEDSKTGYAIYGYPTNFGDEEKLDSIKSENTKAILEDIRQNVVAFTNNNQIICSDKDVETLLNEVVKVLPELRTAIGRIQSPSHSYDVMTHSLKVLREVAKSNEFEYLSQSDKKVMLLSSILHDVSKIEGSTDITHAEEGSFDSFFIAKKFGLTKEEENKLYTIIKHHEWLRKVNTAKNEADRTKQIHDAAYDLRHDNILDLSLIFTKADLKSVKNDGSFATSREGESRIDFNGETRSFIESADFFAEKIKDSIKELQKSQPILPTTKIPKASDIESKITTVNADGSTNLKGVYKNKDGLIIIKYNEVEDFEAIGFATGSKSKGIKTTTSIGDEINTGNIKFIAHGLDYSNQLAKFDAFNLVDSDALLSVSYMERPESKYRLFRPQGILLDVDTKHIHGGGDTDSGSGYEKTVQNFKNNYIFGGARENDRLYISNLIKRATGMNDNDYIEFVNKYQNKSFSEIEDTALRNKLIKAFASINSNKRDGDREYNEMYVSNPIPSAVFAYDINENSNVGNPIDFLNAEKQIKTKHGSHKETTNHNRTIFLQEYAIEHNLPFIIFGD